MQPTIDPELQALCPPLSADELGQLEANILQDGVRDPLKVWAGHGILLDGHNRMAICQAHSVPYSVVEIDLPDRSAARVWVRNNQLGRRNLTPAWLIELQLGNKADLAEIGREKRAATLKQNAPTVLSQNDKTDETAPAHNTRQEIAKAAGVSTGTVAQAEIVKRESPELWEKAKSGDETISGAYRKTRAEQKKRVLDEEKVKIAAQTRESPDAPVVVCASYRDWLSQQPQCDLLLTDPPYSTDVDDVGAFAADWLPLALGKVKATGRAYVCIGSYPKELLSYLSVPSGDMILEDVLVWTYRNTLGPSPSHAYKRNWQAILHYRGREAPPLDCPEMLEQFSVHDINAPDGRQGDRFHSWQKPDKLAERFIRHSTQPGALVLDPFVGTGTFVLAAARLGRIGSGCDISPEILDIAEDGGCARI